MKYLKIERHKGYFWREDTFIEMDKISKEDISRLICIAISNNNEVKFEMDEFSEEVLQHGVHKIIYKNLYNKFLELTKDKEHIHDSVGQQFSTAFQKYSEI